MGSKKLILLSWGRLCELGFELAYAFAIQRRLNDEVYNMLSTAYAVVWRKINIVVFFKALDKLVVIVGGVIADEVVEL